MFERIVVTLAAGAFCSALAACGQKGPLVLPPKVEIPPPPAAVPAAEAPAEKSNTHKK